MSDGLMIAIDGPAAAGKSTIGQKIAEELGFLYFDTGVMYRAVTLAALQNGIDVSSEEMIINLVKSISIDVKSATKNDGRAYDVILDGEDVTWEIRSREVDEHVSQVSTYLGVRRAMTLRQREIGLRGGVVMVGRDIGTVVLPEANLKIYLNASVVERAKRRYEECLARGDKIEFEEILAAMQTRDEIDANRQYAPLLPADDAVRIDTTTLTVDEVIAMVLDLLP
jgi:cytidylate kinase